MLLCSSSPRAAGTQRAGLVPAEGLASERGGEAGEGGAARHGCTCTPGRRRRLRSLPPSALKDRDVAPERAPRRSASQHARAANFLRNQKSEIAGEISQVLKCWLMNKINVQVERAPAEVRPHLGRPAQPQAGCTVAAQGKSAA